MPTLAFAIQADYEKVIRLKREIAGLEQELTKLGSNASPETIAKLQDRISLLNGQLDKTITKAAEAGDKFAQSGTEMMEALNGSSGALKAVQDRLEAITTRTVDLRNLGQTFEEQRQYVGHLNDTIADLQGGYEASATKAQQLKASIDGLSASLQQGIANGMAMEDQKKILDEIENKTLQLGEATTTSAVSAQSAYAIEKDAIVALQSEITHLQQIMLEASSVGQNEVVMAASEQIKYLSSELKMAEENFGTLGQQAQQSAAAMTGVVTGGEQTANIINQENSAILALAARLDELKQKQIDSTALSQGFEAQRAAIESVSGSIAKLSTDTTDYTAKAAQLKQEISTLTRDLNLDRQDSKNSGQPLADEQQRIEAIKAKIQEYKETVAQAASSAQAAYELQKQSVTALEQEIATLTQKQNEAAAGGDIANAQAIAQQIGVVRQQLQQASSNLGTLSQQAKQSDNSLQGVAQAAEQMNTNIQRGPTILGNIADGFSQIKERIGQAGSLVGEWVSSKLEPAKAKVAEVGEAITSRIGGALTSINQHVGFDRLGNALVDYKNKLVNAATGHGKFQESLGNMKTALNGLPIPLGSTISSIQKMGKAMWDLCKTPLGAVLAAVALALQAVHQYFTKSAEGQKAFAKISAYTGSLLQSVTDVVVILGKWLYHAFADNTGPMNNFGKSLIKTFSTAVKTVADLFKGLGKTIKGVLSLDMATIWEGMKDIGSSLAGAVKTAFSLVETNIKGMVGAVKLVGNMFTDDKLSKDLGKAFDDAGKKAKTAADLAAKEIQATKEMAEAKQKAAKLDIEIAEKRDKIYTLTGKAKKELAEEVKLLQKQRYEGQIAAQQKLLSVQKERNRIHTTTLKDLAKERDLQTSVYELQAQQMASTRMMTRMAAMAGRQEERNAKNAAKAAVTAANKDRNQANALTSANEKFAQVERTNAANRAAEAVKLEESITDARIAAMRDGADKVKAERARELEKELVQLDQQRQAAINAEIKRQKDEWDAQQAIVKAQGGRMQEFSLTEEDMKNDPAFKQINEAYDKLADYARQRFELTEKQAQLTAMRDYLKEYGTYQQQKLAIAEEYADKIAKAEAAGETMTARSLEKERDSKVASIGAKSLAMDIDWSQTFQGVGNLLGDIATEALKKVEDYMKTAEFKKLDASDKKAYTELRDKLSKSADNTKGVDAFNFGIWSKVAKDAEAYRNSVKTLSIAEQEHTNAVERVKAAQEALANATDDAAKTIAENELADAKVAESVSAINLEGAKNNVNTAKDNLNDSTTKAQQGLDKFGDALSKMSSGSLKGFYDGIQSLIGKIGGKASGLIGAILQIIDALGNDPKKFFEDIFDKISTAVEKILADLPELIGTILQGVGNVVKSLIDGIGQMFGADKGWLTGSNAKEVEENTKRLSDSNERLKTSIDALKDEMAKGRGGAKTIAAAFEAQKTEQQRRDQQRRILEEQQGYHDNHKSNNHYWDIMSDADKRTLYRGLNGILRQYADKNGKDKASSVGSQYDIYNLSPEELSFIRSQYSDLWNAMTDIGKYDKSEYWNALADMAGGMDEITEKLQQAVTGITFDSLQDSFADALMNMDTTAQDFTQNFTEYLTKAILNARMSDLMQDDMKKFYEKFAKYQQTDKNGNVNANGSGAVMEDWEREDLKKDWDALVEEGLKIRKEVFDFTGYNGDKSSSASSGSFQGMSQDTGNELNGRFTALQAAGERIDANVSEQTKSILQMNITLGELAGKTAESISIADETRDILANSYMELQEINLNTRNTASALKTTNERLQRIENKL